DSIGVLLYCAGTRRLCTPHSRFLMHDIGLNTRPNHRFNERSLGERLASIRNEKKLISHILSSNCNKSLEEIEDAMLRGEVWTSEQAIEYGLTHELRTILYERGADVIEITSS
ncbi:MAG: hypothetical protein FK732_03530, partial [Asgard group archaeon]|nr:hypothetical protein [Asgard group archaeon]